MRELRALSNDVAHAYSARDERLHALRAEQQPQSPRHDHGLRPYNSQVDQDIAELAAADQQRRNTAGRERVARHMP